MSVKEVRIRIEDTIEQLFEDSRWNRPLVGVFESNTFLSFIDRFVAILFRGAEDEDEHSNHRLFEQWLHRLFLHSIRSRTWSSSEEVHIANRLLRISVHR